MTVDPAHPLSESRSADGPGGLGMLLVFPAFVLIVTLAIVVVGSADAWGVLAAALLAVAALTAVVAVMTARLLADDKG